MKSTRLPSRLVRGFTLVELLVVIGIIAVLVGIALPMINYAYNRGIRTRMAADLLVIANGLDAYRADFADYPRIDYASIAGIPIAKPYGASVLAWALLAPGPATGTVPGNPGDGADGPGFTLRIAGQGQIYGPYISPGRLKTNNSIINGACQILDKYQHPYLYFPAFKGATISAAGGYVFNSGTPMYNWNDGDLNGATPTQPILSPTDMQKILGDTGNGTAGNTAQDGAITGVESAAYTGPYILWHGPDETFGYKVASDGTVAKTSDDVTNFNR